jgi:tetratricopeptide (TPR) repeat protein
MTRLNTEAIATYVNLMDLDAKWLPAYIETGHAYLDLKQSSEALNYYLKAIRIANLTGQEIKDPLLFQRAGSIYILEEKWEDARVMFLLCAEQHKTAYSYFNLGVASYNLGLYDEAEKVLGVVNFMDSKNTLTWAYLTLALLNKQNPPINSAFQTMNEALKLGLSDLNLLRDIFTTCLKQGQFRAARDV